MLYFMRISGGVRSMYGAARDPDRLPRPMDITYNVHFQVVYDRHC